MKPNRDANALAAALTTAASKPPPLPAAPQEISAKEAAPSVTRLTAAKGRPATDTVGITLRPSKTLLQRYTIAASERTRESGRVVSAQEIMLEQLERGPS